MTTRPAGDQRPTPTGASRTGNVYLNPVTTERAAVLTSAAESHGELMRAELWVAPGARVVAPHIHPGQSEHFEVIDGRLGVRYGAQDSIARPGDRVEVPAGTVHDWWTVGDEPARVLVEIRPALRFEDMIMTVWGLAAAGRTNAQGMPGLLQLALLAQEWDDIVRFVRPPRWLQRGLGLALGTLARRRGLKGAYPELEERLLVGRLGEILTLTGTEPRPT